jgi:hypothetical protein
MFNCRTPELLGDVECQADEGDATVLDVEGPRVLFHGLDHLLVWLAAFLRLPDIGVAADQFVYFAEGKEGF